MINAAEAVGPDQLKLSEIGPVLRKLIEQNLLELSKLLLGRPGSPLDSCTVHFTRIASPKKASLASFTARGPALPVVLSLEYLARTVSTGRRSALLMLDESSVTGSFFSSITLGMSGVLMVPGVVNACETVTLEETGVPAGWEGASS